ncbi:DUF305 domain-containing protein [Mesorhizobium sp. VNQ89]|uniref:CopM family metallochaperone n=1 Tax=Mesorhizobium quangtriensis TaxID=3157709 RepID=UPI0032B857E2
MSKAEADQSLIEVKFSHGGAFYCESHRGTEVAGHTSALSANESRRSRDRDSSTGRYDEDLFMQLKLKAMLAFAFLFAPTLALAQHDAHHDSDAAAQPSPPAAMVSPQQCAPMMGMMKGMVGEHMSACLAALPRASQAYMRAMMGMHMPMMEAMSAKDPDVAFVKGMIPHHQAAIDMARAVLQFGSDEAAKAMAQQIMVSQQAEIDRMREWLRKRGE